MTVTRPPRTDAHRERDALVQQFHDAGLTPVLSCNGSAPSADIQTMTDVSFGDDGTMRAPSKPGQLVSCWLTERGRARLEVATMPAPSEPHGVRIESA